MLSPSSSAPSASMDPWEEPFLNYSYATAVYTGFDPEENVFEGNESLPFDWTANHSTSSSNGNTTQLEGAGPLVTALTSVVLGLMILVTVIGNVFVIAAILLERHLQSVANYLIVSLAVADLMVACLVMPLGAVYAISQGWILGPELCDMWTSSDVLCCTASILHLVAIAVDRFWAVTNVDYIHTRNSNRICAMIAVVWTVALVVSLAPQFGWKDPDYLDRINLQRRCLVSQDVAYQIFATCSTFYVPLLVILVLYWKIFQTARKRIRRRTNKTNAAKRLCAPSARKKAAAVAAVAVAAAEATSTSTIGSTAAAVALRRESEGEEEDRDSAAHETTAFTITTSATAMTGIENHAEAHTEEEPAAPRRSSSRKSDGRAKDVRGKKESLEAKRERKAAKTLAIITGAFVACWLPFFIMALLMPLCDTCTINEHVSTFFLWLGYFNSTLNPVIYTIFSPEFRNAFKRILCGRASARSSYRPRKLR